MASSPGKRWAGALGLVRLRPFDTGTAEGRSSERHRRVLLSALASALAKVISVATGLISVPLTLHYLGPERYGMWMTISSLLVVLAFADLGIGNGMLNAIAAAHGRDDRAAIRGYVSSGFFVLSLVALGLLLLFAATHRWVPWPALFNVKSTIAADEVGPAMIVFFACFAVGIPLSIVQRVQIALQRGFLASLWQCLASTLGLIGVILAIYCEAGLPWLVLAFMGAPLVAALSNSIVFFGRMQPEIAPVREAVSRTAGLLLIRTGGLFLLLQLVAAVAYASDSLVIAQLLGASAVAQYAVPERMFSLITTVLAMVLAPLWPAYGEAIARGDAQWVRRTLYRSVLLAFVSTLLLSAALILLGKSIIEIWVGKIVDPPLGLFIALGTWKVLEGCGGALAAFLNGASVVRFQLAVASLTLAAAIALKLALVPVLGVSGAVWATVLAYSIFALIPYAAFMPKIIDKAIQKRELAPNGH